MPESTPVNADFEARLQAVFDSQQMLKLMNVRLRQCSAGEAQFEMPFDPKFTQQHGYMHAGAITTLVDNACGYAAYTVIPPGASILTVEFKVNFIAPAKGERFLAIGKVVKPGRTLIVCTGEVLAFDKDETKNIAVMQATMMVMPKS